MIQMKKIQLFIIILAAASVLLCGCSAEWLFTTGTYKDFSRFVEDHDGGVSKQEIFNRFGVPRSFTDEEGERKAYPYTYSDEGKKELLEIYSSEWVYEFYKYDDPADPHRVFITFNGEGVTTKVEMVIVGGG